MNLKKILKNKKILLILGTVLISLIVIILLSQVNTIFGYIKNPDGVKIEQEFEKLNNKTSEDEREYPKVNISSKNILRYTSINEIISIMNNKEDAVIYFGYPTCIYCRTAIQVLMDTAKETEIDAIYYLNADESEKYYNELVNILGEELTEEQNGVRKIYIPLVAFIASGKVVSYNKGTLFSQEDPYQELDESQIEGLSEIYKYGINDVVSSKKNKNK